MVSSPETQVLVCGAGPVGLTAAVLLRSYGCSVRIIDKQDGPTDLSKALTLWARTLELLEGAIDVQQFIESGIPIEGACFHSGMKEMGSFDFSQVPSRYGVGYLLPQSRTERVLIEHLQSVGVEVEWGVELSDFENKDDHVACTLQKADGTQTTLSSSWLIGCDGAHSVVRHKLGLNFVGAAVDKRFVLADVAVEGDIKPNHANIFFNDVGPIFFFPFERDRCRVITDTPDIGMEKGDPDLEEIQSILDERLGSGIRVRDPHWLASFRINDRVVERYRAGRCFLAGDAAHVHSPVGGQGMNTGIQDVVNLCWKIAFHDRGVGSEPLLDSYSAERGYIGERVVSGTKRLTHVLTLRNPIVRFVRETAVRVGLQFEAVQKFLGDALSMIEVNYRKVGIRSADSIPRHSGAIQAGDRIPDLPLAYPNGDLVMLDQVCASDKFTLLVVESPTTPSFDKAIDAMLSGIPDQLKPLLDVVAITDKESSIHSDVPTYLDLEGDVYEKMGFRGHGAVVVRPDRYSALFLGALDATALQKWVDSL